jgi:hypothetical protein
LRNAISLAAALHCKAHLIVYDYVDAGVTMLARMALKRQVGYRSLGYELAAAGTTPAVVKSPT